KAEIEQIEKHNVHLLALGDPRFPAALAKIETAPPLLYCRGTLTDADAQAVAIVGSRHCTAYGRKMAERIAGGLVRAGYTIISGLSRAVVIIEAGDKSGALITARHATEQGREVFAVPANADSLTSAGALKLIRDGARLVRDADDILEDLAGIAPLFSPRATAA